MKIRIKGDFHFPLNPDGFPVVKGKIDLLDYKLGEIELTQLPGNNPLVLGSSSGSGKTRSILERFSKVNGFFFVSGVRDNGGSGDFAAMLSQLIENPQENPFLNNTHVIRSLKFLLKCRSLFYSWLLQQKPDLTPLQWLLAQLHPSQFFSSKARPDADPFLEIYNTLPRDIEVPVVPFSVAFDEAQVLMDLKSYPPYEGQYGEVQPVLSKIVAAVDQTVKVIISGTSADMDKATSEDVP